MISFHAITLPSFPFSLGLSSSHVDVDSLDVVLVSLAIKNSMSRRTISGNLPSFLAGLTGSGSVTDDSTLLDRLCCAEKGRAWLVSSGDWSRESAESVGVEVDMLLLMEARREPDDDSGSWVGGVGRLRGCPGRSDMGTLVICDLSWSSGGLRSRIQPMGKSEAHKGDSSSPRVSCASYIHNQPPSLRYLGSQIVDST